MKRTLRLLLVTLLLPSFASSKDDDEIEMRVYEQTAKQLAIAQLRTQALNAIEKTAIQASGGQGEAGALTAAYSLYQLPKAAEKCDDAKTDSEKYRACSHLVADLVAFVPVVGQIAQIMVAAQDYLAGPIIEQMSDRVTKIYEEVIRLEKESMEIQKKIFVAERREFIMLYRRFLELSEQLDGQIQSLGDCHQLNQNSSLDSVDKCFISSVTSLSRVREFVIFTKTLSELIVTRSASMGLLSSPEDVEKLSKSLSEKMTLIEDLLSTEEGSFLDSKEAYLTAIASIAFEGSQDELLFRCISGLNLLEKSLLEAISKVRLQNISIAGTLYEEIIQSRLSSYQTDLVPLCEKASANSSLNKLVKSRLQIIKNLTGQLP